MRAPSCRVTIRMSTPSWQLPTPARMVCSLFESSGLQLRAGRLRPPRWRRPLPFAPQLFRPSQLLWKVGSRFGAAHCRSGKVARQHPVGALALELATLVERLPHADGRDVRPAVLHSLAVVGHRRFLEVRRLSPVSLSCDTAFVRLEYIACMLIHACRQRLPVRHYGV